MIKNLWLLKVLLEIKIQARKFQLQNINFFTFGGNLSESNVFYPLLVLDMWFLSPF